MLGRYVQVMQQSDLALKRVTGKACACTFPRLYCAGGLVVAYEVGAYVAGQKQRIEYFFDAEWQPLVSVPAGAQACCQMRDC